MIITAKFTSTCPKCNSQIASGTKVEWSKGTQATHVDCGSAKAAAENVATSAVCRCGRPKKEQYATCFRCSPASRKCQTCGRIEQRNARGYLEGGWVRNGECQDCYEERKMGY